MVDEIMNRISILLPEWQRGEYPEPERASTSYLRFVSLG